MTCLRIAKPILLTITPLGIGLGLVEAAAQYTVTRLRRERRGSPDA
jgi:hypothetical protein